MTTTGQNETFLIAESQVVFESIDSIPVARWTVKKLENQNVGMHFVIRSDSQNAFSDHRRSRSRLQAMFHFNTL